MSINSEKTLNMKQSTGLAFIYVFVGVIATTFFFNFSTVPYTQNSGNNPEEKNSASFTTKRIPEKYGVISVEIPGELEFAGEKVPLTNFEIRESLERELTVNTYWQSQTLLLLKRAPRYFSIIEPILKEEGVPDDFKYVAVAESGLIDRALSPVKAAGIWQFMHSTGREYGLIVNSEVDERYHLEKATRAACKYFRKHHKSYGNWTIVAAAYNAGKNGINKQIKRQKENNYYDLLLGEETGRYLFRILSYKVIFTNPENYGFYLKKEDIYPVIPTKEVTISTSVNDFADFASKHGINYKILKFFNPWLRQTNLTLKTGETYLVKIPEKGYRNFDN